MEQFKSDNYSPKKSVDFLVKKEISKSIDSKNKLDEQFNACINCLKSYKDSPQKCQALINACYSVAKTSDICQKTPGWNNGWQVGKFITGLIDTDMSRLVAVARGEKTVSQKSRPETKKQKDKIYKAGETFGNEVKPKKIHEILPANQTFSIQINNNLGQVPKGTYNIIWENDTYVFEDNPQLGRVKILPGDKVLEYNKNADNVLRSEEKFKVTSKIPESFDIESIYNNLDIRNGFSIEEVSSKTNQKVIISKSGDSLKLYENNKLVFEISTDSGRSREFDKKREGDSITPLGIFYISEKKPNSKYQKALLISYPNIEDAERGLKDGIINQQEHDQIVNAINKGETPPQNTGLGGLIEIHGEYKEENTGINFLDEMIQYGVNRTNWTAGCVAMSEEDIKKLYGKIKPQSTVIILP